MHISASFSQFSSLSNVLFFADNNVSSEIPRCRNNNRKKKTTAMAAICLQGKVQIVQLLAEEREREERIGREKAAIEVLLSERQVCNASVTRAQAF